MLFSCPIAILPLQPHRASLSHSAMKMLVDSRGSLRYSPEDLTFAVQAGAEDPEYIALVLRRTGEHVWADRPPHRYLLPAREDESLNAAISIHRRSGPG